MKVVGFIVVLSLVGFVNGLARSGLVSVSPSTPAKPAGPTNGWGFQKDGVLSATVAVQNGEGDMTEADTWLDRDYGCTVVANASADLPNTNIVHAAAMILRKSEWTDIQALIATEEGLTESNTTVFTSVCTYPSLMFAPIPSDGQQTTLIYNVTYEDQLILIVALCGQGRTLVVNYNVSYVNPGGNEASLENIAITVVSFGFTLVFFGLFVGWAAYLVFSHCREKGVFGLQLALLLSILCKGLESIVVALVKDQNSAIPKVLVTLSETWFLVVQFLMCIGWSVNTKQIPVREKNVMWLLSITLVVVGVIVAACGGEGDGKCSEGTRNASSLVYAGTRVIFLLYCGWTLNTNLESLRKALETADDPMAMKHFFRYRAVRFPYCVSLPIPLFVYFLEAAVLTWRGGFVSALISHLTTLYVILCIMIFFRSGLIIF